MMEENKQTDKANCSLAGIRAYRPQLKRAVETPSVAEDPAYGERVAEPGDTVSRTDAATIITEKRNYLK